MEKRVSNCPVCRPVNMIPIALYKDFEGVDKML